MFAFLYETMFSCDVLMFITLMTSYVPLFIIVFKTMDENMEESIRIEKNMFKRIQELETENNELKAKLEPLYKEIDDEKLSIKKPLEDDEGDELDNEGDDEGDELDNEEDNEEDDEGDDVEDDVEDELDNEGDDVEDELDNEGDNEKKTNNLTELFSEDLNCKNI
jgi:hypothetical protein